MNVQRFLLLPLVMGLAGPLWAQTSKPLNLTLPPSTLPMVASSASTPPDPRAPGVYYGDTSGRVYGAETARRAAPDCDDYSYNKPQVHGSVGVGVMGGSHVRGNYETGTFNMSKAFGSCSQPSGGINISVSVGRSEFDGRGH